MGEALVSCRPLLVRSGAAISDLLLTGPKTSVGAEEPVTAGTMFALFRFAMVGSDFLVAQRRFGAVSEHWRPIRTGGLILEYENTGALILCSKLSDIQLEQSTGPIEVPCL